MQGAGQGASAFTTLIPFVLIFAVFYFLVILPARKQQRKKDAMIASLKKGDRVITSGGIHGTVAGVEDQALMLKVAENVKIRVAKSAIAGKIGPGGDAATD